MNALRRPLVHVAVVFIVACGDTTDGGTGAKGGGDPSSGGAGGASAGGNANGGDGPSGGGPEGGASAGGGGASASSTILFQCTPFDGGICTMNADGSGRQTLNESGFTPHGDANGAVLFHTAAYRVNRRSSDGSIADLGDGAFARPNPSGGILFQCTGLGGGICTMNDDGGDRQQVRATGRAPDVDESGRILLHSDAYRVILRDAGGEEDDLGDGAFATWSPDGSILFQCSGLGGGLCAMNADGSGRETLDAVGRVPEGNQANLVLFHTDAYEVGVWDGGRVETLDAGANATWW